MTPKELQAHKLAKKSLPGIPNFKALKRNKLPRPFHKLGGPRVFATGLVDVSDDHVALLYWRDGPTLTDRAFFGHLMCRVPGGNLYPVFEFHWHPSHKGLHCKTPCKTSLDYTNRHLPGAPEMALKSAKIFDPMIEPDRLELVLQFCKACGISPPDSSPETQPLWS